MANSGIGLVTKKAKNHFEWVGGDVDSNGQVEPDELELQRFFDISHDQGDCGEIVISAGNTLDIFEQLFRLRQWEKELSQAIEQQETQLRYMTESNDIHGYVTCKDIRSIFNRKMILCIKVLIEIMFMVFLNFQAPLDTKLQIPESSEGIQLLMKSTRGPIECYLCPETDLEAENSDQSNVPTSRNAFIMIIF